MNGKDGAPGVAGKDGAPGPEGKEGKPGSPWTVGGTLPKGQTEKGDWSITASASGPFTFAVGSVSFVIPLESAPIPVYNRKGQAAKPHCTGSAGNPGAEPGYLCVFASENGEEDILSEPEPHKELPTICDLSTKTPLNCVEGAETCSANAYGFGVLAASEKAGLEYAGGTWAVTAE